MADSEAIVWLVDQWEKTIGDRAFENPSPKEVWKEIFLHYQEPHRAYHTLTHIRALLELWEAHKSKMDHPKAVAFAIWFHDLIYDPFRQDNESRSAERARAILESWQFLPELIRKVVQLIEDTAGHQPTHNDIDTLLFLDMDLSILGASEKVYGQYTDQIREEYRQVPDALYLPGRQKILSQFLKRTPLYFTPEFRDRYEAQARANLANELQGFEAP